MSNNVLYYLIVIGLIFGNIFFPFFFYLLSKVAEQHREIGAVLLYT